MGLGGTDAGTCDPARRSWSRSATVIATMPAARLSDRIGRKPVIYASCVIGAAGMAILAIAPALPVA